MTTGTISVFDVPKQGWTFPDRAIKAHYFNYNKTTSACGAYPYEQPLLRTQDFTGFEVRRLCLKCLGKKEE